MCFYESNDTFYHFFTLGYKSIFEDTRLFQDLGIFRNERGDRVYSQLDQQVGLTRRCPRRRLENLVRGGGLIVRSKGKQV